MRRVATVVALVTLAAACTRASEDADKDKPEAKKKKKPPGPMLSKALSVDVNTFSPEPTDHAGVMIRFDRIRGSKLGDVTEQLLGILPDHHRVVGNTGKKVTDVFNLVLITSSDPSLQTATNMSAHMAITPPKMRDLLNNKVFPTFWKTVFGGALGEPARPSWDTRVYLIPMPDWIVLVKPARVAGVNRNRFGSLDVYPAQTSLPRWLRKVPQLINLGSRRLVALSALNKLPKHISPPVVGRIDLPARLRAALERGPRHDVVSGELVFDTAAKASAFEKAALAARAMLRAYTPQPRGPQIPAIGALRKLRLRVTGKKLQFSMAMTHAQTVELTRYSIGLIRNMMAAPTPPPVPVAPKAP